jgi:hypothetical protein
MLRNDVHTEKNACYLTCEGQTIKRAVLQALREGSFLLSILPCRIVSFSAMEKERRKKEEMLNFKDSLKIVVSDARVTMLNNCDSEDS